MDEAHTQLLQTVFRHFLATAEWPKSASLQIEFRRFGNIAKLAAEIGHDKISCDPSRAEGTCRLTLRGVAECDGGEREIQRFVFTVRALARRYIQLGAPEELTLSDVVAELELSELELRRLGQLIRVAPGLYSGLGTKPSGDVSLTPRDDIWYFEDVENIEDFYVTLRRANEEAQAASQVRLPRPPGFSALTSSRPSPIPGRRHQGFPHFFVDAGRLAELRAIKHQKFDMARLIALCEELNICVEHGCVFALAALTRAIIDHVPPIFGLATFAQVASNYGGGKSFKESMRHLENSARKIADSHLHLQIRSKEVLPTPTQVDFSRELDVMLGEIVRILS